jgi:hypothetical protein
MERRNRHVTHFKDHRSSTARARAHGGRHR